MNTTTERASAVVLETRVINEGYGPGAWHGPDLKAAIADITPSVAYWRPAAGRHNIAEIVLHHAYYVHSVRAQLSGAPAEPFVLAGEDWFPVDDAQTMSWTKIMEVAEAEQRDLLGAVSGAATSSLTEAERFALVLGITCHAVYHAGQVQLVKRLQG